MKNKYWITAGLLNLLTFFAHLIGGQIDLVNPMSNVWQDVPKLSQMIGAWHMITIILLGTSIVLLSAGFHKKYATNSELIQAVGYLNLAFCLPFIGTGLYFGMLVPQWIFFLPIGILTILGIKKPHINQ